MRVQKQSGKNTVQVAQGVHAEVERINREIPTMRLAVLDLPEGVTIPEVTVRPLVPRPGT